MHKNVKYIFTMTDIHFLYIKEWENLCVLREQKHGDYI